MDYQKILEDIYQEILLMPKKESRPITYLH